MEMHRKDSHWIGETLMIRLYSDKNISMFKSLLSRSDGKSVLKCQDANIAHVLCYAKVCITVKSKRYPTQWNCL